jgi:Flp pilus assembly protein TadD/SAM-dependent methyltransferase
MTALAAARARATGDKARDEKRWLDAIEAYFKFLRLRPDAAGIWVQLGHCLTKSGNAEEAEKAYLEALALKPENPDTLLHLGRIKRSMNDEASAEHYLERAAGIPSPSLDAKTELLALRSSSADRALASGNGARDEKRWADAIEGYNAFLRVRPDAANIWVQLGHCLRETVKAVESEKAYLKALELDPDKQDTLLHLGRIKQLMNDPASAAHYFERAAALPSPSLDALEELQALQSSRVADVPTSPSTAERPAVAEFFDRIDRISRDRITARALSEPAELERFAAELARPVNASSQPSSLATAIGLRDVANLRVNSKMLAAYVAELTYKSNIPAKAVDGPTRIGAGGRVCKQSDFSSSWFFYWADRLKFSPQLHRKLWEDAYVVQCLWERGCLEAGKTGLGFAVGTEALPSLFVGCGARITATDLSADDERSRGWSLTHQHASNIEVLWKPHLVDRDEFLKNCSFEFVDMTSIPSKFDGLFDFCWSVCAFEHLGTLQKGLEFVREATRALKPGGVAVHTTEYNVQDGETIDNWATVLYQKKHFAILQAMIEECGCRLVDIDFDVGREFFDSYIDLPPYPHDDATGLAILRPPHVKLSVDGFPATSIAIIVEKPLARV